MITDENGSTQIFDSEAEADLNRMNITHPSNKPKVQRARKPWVYKSEFDLLERKYKRLSIYSVIISMLFILALIASFN